MKTSSYSAVIGLGFGDEGKGNFTNYLCFQKNSDPSVVRYSGGHQAGHTVVHNGIRHVFSNFGSGTLAEASTFWSKYCAVDPIALINELGVLLTKNVMPLLYIDARCPVTTPYDKLHNWELEKKNKHGSVGFGVGATLERERNFYSLTFEDLLQ